MNAWAMILTALGAVGLIVLVGEHRWPVPRRLHPWLIFVGFGGILSGMGLFALSLAMG